jgi:beta-alanine--pyruvate transaminase
MCADPGQTPGQRVFAPEHSFFNEGIMIRPAGDTIELTPPLIVSEEQIGQIMDKVGASIKAAA